MSFVLFGRLLVLRANPQDLPVSKPVLAGTLVAYAAADVLGALPKLPVALGAMAGTLDMLTLVIFVQVLLRLRGLDNRLIQTLTALAGCGALLTTISWAVAMALDGLAPPGAVYLVSLVWYLTVSGHILRHAIDRSFPVSVALSLLLFIIATTVIELAVGNPATAN
jgi:hypothetical protein